MPEWLHREIIPIITIPKFGDRVANTLYEHYEIKLQNDRVKLKKAHDECYREEFVNGTMIIGNYKGKPELGRPRTS